MDRTDWRKSYESLEKRLDKSMRYGDSSIRAERHGAAMSAAIMKAMYSLGSQN